MGRDLKIDWFSLKNWCITRSTVTGECAESGKVQSLYISHAEDKNVSSSIDTHIPFSVCISNMKHTLQ